jgi:hypothetical protein
MSDVILSSLAVQSFNQQLNNSLAAWADIKNLERQREYLKLELAEKQVEQNDKMIELLEEIKKLGADSLPPILRSKVGAVAGMFRQFENDYLIMRTKDIIKIDFDKNQFIAKKGFVYDYFKLLSPDDNIYWKPMEILFGLKNMRSALGNRTMLTVDMDKWIELNGLDKNDVENKVLYTRKDRK